MSGKTLPRVWTDRQMGHRAPHSSSRHLSSQCHPLQLPHAKALHAQPSSNLAQPNCMGNLLAQLFCHLAPMEEQKAACFPGTQQLDLCYRNKGEGLGE